jgi:hypothetical protein
MVAASASSSASASVVDVSGVENQLMAGGQAVTDTSLLLGTSTSTPSMAPRSAKVVRKKPRSGKEKVSGRNKVSSVQGKGSGKKTNKGGRNQVPRSPALTRLYVTRRQSIVLFPCVAGKLPRAYGSL